MALLTISGISYEPQTGLITVSTAGGNGSAIIYRAIGLADWQNSNQFTVPTHQRNGYTFTVQVLQDGYELTTEVQPSDGWATPTPPTPTPPTPTQQNPPTPPVTPVPGIPIRPRPPITMPTGIGTGKGEGTEQEPTDSGNNPATTVAATPQPTTQTSLAGTVNNSPTGQLLGAVWVVVAIAVIGVILIFFRSRK